MLGQGSCACRFAALGCQDECESPNLDLMSRVLLHPQSVVAHPVRTLPRAAISLDAVAVRR